MHDDPHHPRPASDEHSAIPWALERYLSNDLGPEERAAFEARLAQDPVLRAQKADLEAERAAFLTSHPPAALLARFSKKSAWWRGWHGAVVWLSLSATAAAMTLFLYAPWPTKDRLTAKGGLSIELFKLDQGRAVGLATGATVRPGERVKFIAHLPHAGHLAVFSLDRHGALSPLVPPAMESAVPVEPGVYDPRQSFSFDPSPGPQRVVAVLAAERFSMAEVVEAIAVSRRELGSAWDATTARLPLPGHYTSYRLQVVAEGPP